MTWWILATIVGTLLIFAGVLLIVLIRDDVDDAVNPALFGYLDVFQQDVFQGRGWQGYVDNLHALPLDQKLWAVIIGILTACGEAGMYFAVDKVPLACDLHCIVVYFGGICFRLIDLICAGVLLSHK